LRYRFGAERQPNITEHNEEEGVEVILDQRLRRQRDHLDPIVDLHRYAFVDYWFPSLVRLAQSSAQIEPQALARLGKQLAGRRADGILEILSGPC
jgi:hypothetical protein